MSLNISLPYSMIELRSQIDDCWKVANSYSVSIYEIEYTLNSLDSACEKINANLERCSKIRRDGYINQNATNMTARSANSFKIAEAIRISQSSIQSKLESVSICESQLRDFRAEIEQMLRILLSILRSNMDDETADRAKVLSLINHHLPSMYGESENNISYSPKISHGKSFGGSGTSSEEMNGFQTCTSSQTQVQKASYFSSLSSLGNSTQYKNAVSPKTASPHSIISNDVKQGKNNGAMYFSLPESTLPSFDEQDNQETGSDSVSEKQAILEFHDIEYTETVYDGDYPHKEHKVYCQPVYYDDDKLPTTNEGLLSFENQKAAVKWAEKTFSKWRKSLSKSEVSAIQVYGGSSYDHINDQNRGKEPKEDKIMEISQQIDNGLNKASLPCDMLLYRAIDMKGLLEMARQSGGTIQSGMILFDQSFISTSLTTDTVFCNQRSCILRLTAPAGLHGAPLLNDLASYDNEAEICFARNHEIYVTHVTQCPRCEIVKGSSDTSLITVIDGIITI